VRWRIDPGHQADTRAGAAVFGHCPDLAGNVTGTGQKNDIAVLNQAIKG